MISTTLLFLVSARFVIHTACPVRYSIRYETNIFVSTSVETSGNERNRVDVQGEHPTNAKNLSTSPAPTEAITVPMSAIQELKTCFPHYMKMSFVAACVRILTAGKNRRGTEKVASTGRIELVNKVRERGWADVMSVT